MNVLVETTPLYTSRAGVARYVRGLLHGLRSPGVAPDIDAGELGWQVENVDYRQPRRAIMTLLREWGWAKFIAPWQAREADVLHHSAMPVIPRTGRARQVATLHDLAVLRHPARFRPWQRMAGVRRLRRLRAMDRIICVSRFTADEAMGLLDLPASRLEVVHEGGWLPETAAQPVPAGTGPTEEFFLFVGSLEPGKNLVLLREVYLRAARTLPPLVVVGARWEGVRDEGAAPPGWHYVGHVDDAVLADLYRRALALLFPSRYEGFGLPVLEAMAHGCPVLCGPVASLPEIAGEAAAYADLEPVTFGAAVRRLADDLAWRRQLSEAGSIQARQFSWEKCAAETAEIYRGCGRRTG